LNLITCGYLVALAGLIISNDTVRIDEEVDRFLLTVMLFLACLVVSFLSFFIDSGLLFRGDVTVL
jgi:hypothetical protein